MVEKKENYRPKYLANECSRTPVLRYKTSRFFFWDAMQKFNLLRSVVKITKNMRFEFAKKNYIKS